MALKKILGLRCLVKRAPGPGCSILTTSLVNVSLKFQRLRSEIRQYFLLKNVRSFSTAKASLIFFNKNISAFGYKVIKFLTSWPLNELVRLMMLWTIGPRFLWDCVNEASNIYSTAVSEWDTVNRTTTERTWRKATQMHTRAYVHMQRERERVALQRGVLPS